MWFVLRNPGCNRRVFFPFANIFSRDCWEIEPYLLSNFRHSAAKICFPVFFSVVFSANFLVYSFAYLPARQTHSSNYCYGYLSCSISSLMETKSRLYKISFLISNTVLGEAFYSSFLVHYLNNFKYASNANILLRLKPVISMSIFNFIKSSINLSEVDRFIFKTFATAPASVIGSLNK